MVPHSSENQKNGKVKEAGKVKRKRRKQKRKRGKPKKEAEKAKRKRRKSKDCEKLIRSGESQETEGIPLVVEEIKYVDASSFLDILKARGYNDLAFYERPEAS